MDLGLKELDDDQLLELLGQCCGELVERDPVVRNVAQATIVDESEKLRLMKESAEEAVQACRADYIAALKTEVLAHVREAVKSGELRLVPAAEEAREVAIADLEARVKLCDEEIATLANEEDPEALFRLRYADGYMEADVRLDGFFQRRHRVQVPEGEVKLFVGQVLSFLRRPRGEQPVWPSTLGGPW
jgi:hypothetical protein